MADSTIDSELFVLIDNWPGVYEGRVLPYDNFTSTAAGHNISAETSYPRGTKMQVWNGGTTGVQGWSGLIYLKFVANGDVALAAKQVVVPDVTTDIYTVTNDPDDCLVATGGLGAIAISAMTDGYFGWFWHSGVAPEFKISALGGNYATEGTVVAGPIVFHDLANTDAIGLGPCGAVTEMISGWSLSADVA